MQDTGDSNRALGWSPEEPGNHLDIRSSREEACLIKRGQFRDAGFSVALLHQTLIVPTGSRAKRWQGVHQLVCILVQLSFHVQDRLSLFAPDVGPLSAPTRLVSSNRLLLRERLVHIKKMTSGGTHPRMFLIIWVLWLISVTGMWSNCRYFSSTPSSRWWFHADKDHSTRERTSSINLYETSRLLLQGIF